MHVKVKRAGPRSPKPATGPCLVRHSCALRGCSNLPSVHDHRLASSHTDPYFCSCLPGLCPVSRKPECPNPHNLHRSDPRWPERWEHASVTRECSIEIHACAIGSRAGRAFCFGTGYRGASGCVSGRRILELSDDLLIDYFGTRSALVYDVRRVLYAGFYLLSRTSSDVFMPECHLPFLRHRQN